MDIETSQVFRHQRSFVGRIKSISLLISASLFSFHRRREDRITFSWDMMKGPLLNIMTTVRFIRQTILLLVFTTSLHVPSLISASSDVESLLSERYPLATLPSHHGINEHQLNEHLVRVTRNPRLCGPNLVDALQLVCQGRYHPPTGKRNGMLATLFPDSHHHLMSNKLKDHLENGKNFFLLLNFWRTF